MPLYSDRIGGWHKYMGTRDMCDECSGTGLTYRQRGEDPDNCVEAYCDCECGRHRAKLEAD